MLHAAITTLLRHDLFQYVQSGDPGAVGAGKNWLDTTTAAAPIWKRRNDADNAWITMVTGGGGGVPTSRTINTTAPLTGGGDLSADRTFAITDFAGTAAGAVPTGSGNVATVFLNGQGGWTVPPGTGGSGGTAFGAFASRPAAGNAGSVYVSTDSPGLTSIDDGAVWNDFFNGVPVTLLDTTGFAWTSQGDATLTQKGGFYELVGSTQNGDNLASQEITLTDHTFTAVLGIAMFGPHGTTNQCIGVKLRNDGAERTAFWALTCGASSANVVAQYSDYTTTPSTTAGSVGIDQIFDPPSGLYLLKIVGDGTNITFSYSNDGGLTYIQYNQIAIASLGGGSLTNPNRVGFMVHTLGTTTITPNPPPRAEIVHWVYTP